MGKPSDAVARRMEQKVNADTLYMSGPEDLHARVTLELAVEIERAKDRDYVVVSMTSQREAAAYFNTYGFADTLDHMLKLRDKTTNQGG
jgi:hypothetical protein